MAHWTISHGALHTMFYLLLSASGVTVISSKYVVGEPVTKHCTQYTIYDTIRTTRRFDGPQTPIQHPSLPSNFPSTLSSSPPLGHPFFPWPSHHRHRDGIRGLLVKTFQVGNEWVNGWVQGVWLTSLDKSFQAFHFSVDFEVAGVME